MNPRLPAAHLILGGVRSGKSAYAEQQALDMGLPTVYLATGQAGDPEMEQRIQRHRRRRPTSWQTLEEPLDPAQCLAGYLQSPENFKDQPAAVVVDSIDFWVANLMMHYDNKSDLAVEEIALDSASRLLEVGRKCQATLLLVSAEVGLTLVPPEPLGRRFQDLLGLVNQRIAASADRVTLVVAGVPLAVKDSAT